MIPPINIQEVTTIIKDFIHTYVEQSHTTGVIIGFSGGIDSAIAAILCQQSLGNKKVDCLFLKETTTPPNDTKHVTILQQTFNLNVKTLDISRLVKEIQKECLIKPDIMALANIKARLRMILLYEQANMTNRLVCGTSNKSELLIGYFTKYGDGGTDIFPLGDVYKTYIYQIAKYLKIPEEIIKKPPTAGLCRGQTDETDFGMSYATLDDILWGLERKEQIKDIAQRANVTIQDVRRIQRMRKQSQHKRRLPLIPKIGMRTPGLDWREPVQEG